MFFPVSAGLCLHAWISCFMKCVVSRGVGLGEGGGGRGVVGELHLIHIFFLMHRSHSISFTRAQGIPKYKIGFGRGKDGRVGIV